ncbi:MAG: hypothetical protein BWX88_00656 [Planctomycetes bacterium ADurb.Bin126]|nr:MAG: hypothetical protein BWX88_00656 [Planctomycetes bacterium ADurb.Bin126]HOD81533.1 hypothetical protein [Phycisphaerae bacterium]HQL75044.1 hypothetical protein [Phycisphaerae bacterium]
MKGAKLMMVGLVLAFLAGPVLAQDAMNAALSAQNKLLAQRAARLDGIRKLAERIQGLHITSETLVKDFVTESDTISAAMNTWINGMKETSVKYMEDGTCEVTLEVALVTVIQELKEISNRYYKGNKFRAEDFSQMTQTNKVTMIKETGMGAPRGPAEMVPVTAETTVESLTLMGNSAKQFWLARVMPQGRLGAVRAARVDAMRKLVERLFGTNISSQTLVRDFVTEADQVNALAAALLRGAREVGVKYHDDELIVEVSMEVTWRTVYETVKQFSQTNVRGNTAAIRALEERTQRVEDKVIREIGMGVPNPRYLKVQADVAVVQAMTTSLNKWPPAISAKGNGAIDTNNPNAAQAKLMAFRAAELDARRKLGEQIQGLMLTSSTSVRDFVTEHDQIRSQMITFQTGAHVVDGSQKVMEDGSVEVTVEIDPAPLWDYIGTFIQQKSITIR